LNYVKNFKFLEFKKIEDEAFGFEVLQIGNLYGVAIIESRNDFADFFLLLNYLRCWILELLDLGIL